ncbi:PBP1A family penicillin-binding protein [Anaerobacillus alkaliphilus]|uniref:PBP1A family penicillin-binding protein n=1 Tax=Anaerobacillus alkaliphilus TaxID=1548597 RepID=A0A4Q0VUB2_9BACI|nr:PBP1A family penicillin-binding protein [Anaerobacillus alkaliphilus]RXI99897.1 PBP1A family penicillin-binding protein [Anaerobacillus alkaliphilus]
MKKNLFIGILLFSIMTVLSFSIYITIIIAGNYAIDNKKLVMDAATTLVDQNGEVVTKLFVENREIVQISLVPKNVQHAFVAMEDARFYEHRGIDFRAIARALYRDIVARGKVEGGSTITQQLVKNTFLTNEKTWLRKTKEVLIAINLERRYSKEAILEMYLNRIYFGHGAYGIQAASKLYFNKDISELTIDEGALLASLPKAPNTYSPFNNIELSKQRRDLTLSVMERRGYLTAEEAVRLQGRTIKVDFNRITQNPAYLTYIDMVLDEAAELYQLSSTEILRGGYTIVVPMDLELQKKSYEMFQSPENFPNDGPNQLVESAFVLLDSDSGGVVVAQGGRNYVRSGLNRVHVKRQPGSAIKPLVVYSPAIETGLYGPYSLLKDELLNYGGYEPRNYNNSYEGMLTMYDALKDSSNASAVWLLNELTVNKGKSYLEKLNIPIEDDGLALALGGMAEGLSPLQLATAYRPFSRDGKKIEPYFIQKIYDRNGKLVGERVTFEEQVLSPQTAWYMTRMLEAVVNEGTGRHGKADIAIAGKTGTTSYQGVKGGARDVWFVGYTSKFVGALWMGFDRTDNQHYLTVGSSYPTKLFKEIVNDESSLVAFEKPDHVQELESPVRFVEINDLKADLTFKGLGLNVRLNWTTSDDERLRYHIYEVSNNGILLKVGQVDGVGEYIIHGVNLFSLNDYVVKPYNPQTNTEGGLSNQARVNFAFRNVVD